MAVSVIYLLGTSFCGSTFLSAVLSAHPNVENAGQLNTLFLHQKVPDRRICSCGIALVDCPFWNAVWKRWYIVEGNGIEDEYRRLILQYERLRAIPRLLSKTISSQDTEFAAYKKRTLSLYRSISEVSGRDFVVDASKYPGRGLAVARMEEIDVYFVHLVRDGMAYVSSVLKHFGHRYKNEIFRLTLKACLEWALVNMASEYVVKESHRPAIMLRYEDFVARPEESLQRLGAVLNLDLKHIGEHLVQGGEVSFRHTTGNAVRLQGPLPMRVDQSWRARLPSYAPLLFRISVGWHLVMAIARRIYRKTSIHDVSSWSGLEISLH